MSGGEPFVALSQEDVRALMRGADACLEFAAGGHNAGRHARAEVALRGVLQAARNRLADALALDPCLYLDESAWPEGQDAPAWLDGVEREALELAARACGLKAAGRTSEAGRAWQDARRTLEGLRQRAEANLRGSEEAEP